jgi:hypothetical protein
MFVPVGKALPIGVSNRGPYTFLKHEDSFVMVKQEYLCKAIYEMGRN